MTPLVLADRVATLQPSVTVAITNLAKTMRREGHDILSFAAGEPDFDTPEPIKAAAKAAMDAGQTKYMPTLGDPETREVVAAKLREENGIPGITWEHVGVSAGGKHTIFLAIHCLFDRPPPGEEPLEALLPTPLWVSYDPIVRLAGGAVREIEASCQNDFKITPEQLAEAITPRSRLLVLNSPSNPCGTMYTPDELRALAAVIAEKTEKVAPQLVVMSDEIYEKIIYGGIDHFSIGSVPEIADRTLTVNGMSKAFAMTGWRIGYAGMPGEFGKKLIGAIGKLQGQMTTNITSFNYAAMRCALTEPAVKDEVERMRLAFAARASLIHGRLEAIDRVSCARPTGAFYAFPDISGLCDSTSPGGRRIECAKSLCEALLHEAKVAFVPGDDFGGCGPKHVRISFACSDEQIEEGMDRFRAFADGIRTRR